MLKYFKPNCDKRILQLFSSRPQFGVTRKRPTLGNIQCSYVVDVQVPFLFYGHQWMSANTMLTPIMGLAICQ
jgi:hypothetical protein